MTSMGESPQTRRIDAAHESRAETMQAVVHDRYGPADVFRLEKIALPVPAEGEVLVRVHAAGVDRGTWHLMTGRPYVARIALGLRRPLKGAEDRTEDLADFQLAQVSLRSIPHANG